MSRSLIFINPHAAGGAAAQAWQRVEADFTRLFGAPMVAVTQSPTELPEYLTQAAAEGIQQVFSVGGDGTNHAVVNAIMHYQKAHPEKQWIYGSIPAGTGQDWARGLGMPLNTRRALDWLKNAQPRPCDVGHVTFAGEERYFLNICSAGISNDVVKRVEKGNKKLPWTFLVSTISGILNYAPEGVRVELDGQFWYEGHMYIITIANGSYFGQGMNAAPAAEIDDGVFEVMFLEGGTRLRLLQLLPRVYRGTHIFQPDVRVARAKTVRVTTTNGAALGMDLDGEPAGGSELIYTIRPHALQILR